MSIRLTGILILWLVASVFPTRSARIEPHHISQSAPASQLEGKKAEEQFKNIQVLKGIPADQLIPTMQFISASLGVECEFCHVEKAFDKDDKKPKQTARKMMTMMFAINKDNFAGHREVTCYSCHRGSTKPIAIPVVAGDTVAENTPVKSDVVENKSNSGPSADELIEKYVQVTGGTAAIEKISSRAMKGTISFGDKSFPIEIYSKTPEKRISFTHMPQGDNVTAFDGHEGWLAMTGRPVHEMHGSELEAAAIDADLQLATHLKGMFTLIKVQGTEKIDNHDAYVVVGERADKPPIQLYFDQQTGLLVRMLRFGETALGRMPTQIDYADYRKSEGVEVPFRWTLSRPGGRFTIQISQMEQNVPVDDTKFVKPTPPPDSNQGAGK